MARTLFVAAGTGRPGKTGFCLGLMSALNGMTPGAGYMKPVGQRYAPGRSIDEDASLISQAFGLTYDAADLCPLSLHDAEKQMLAGGEKEVLKTIRLAHERISRSHDVIVVEGTDPEAVAPFEANLNCMIARELEAHVLLVMSGAGGRTAEELVNEAQLSALGQTMDSSDWI